MKSVIHVVVCAALCIGTVAFAESLEMKRKHKQEQDQLDKRLAKANDICGTKLAGSIDYGDSTPEEWAGKDIAGSCGGALEAMQQICEQADGKASVQKSIRKFSCKLIKGKEHDVKVSGGSLNVSVGPSSVWLVPSTKEYLLKTLE
jgi:hypothetical protein